MGAGMGIGGSVPCRRALRSSCLVKLEGQRQPGARATQSRRRQLARPIIGGSFPVGSVATGHRPEDLARSHVASDPAALAPLAPAAGPRRRPLSAACCRGYGEYRMMPEMSALLKLIKQLATKHP